MPVLHWEAELPCHLEQQAVLRMHAQLGRQQSVPMR